jgi:predicted dehydrogenase
MGDRLRVGLIGLGRVAELHLRGYLEDASVEVAALCDRSPERRAAFADRVPGARLCADLQSFLDCRLDLVEVLTPHPSHCAITEAALAAGAHVSVQKPMALSLEEADRMAAAARAAGRVLRVFENYVFYPPLQRARALLQEGAIGRPLHVRLRSLAGDSRGGWVVEPPTRQWRAELQRESGVGRLTFDDGHHKMATALWLFGPVKDVFAMIDTTDSVAGPLDAPASIVWRHRDGPHGIWDIVYAPRFQVPSDYYTLDECIEITGETGTITVTRATARREQGAPLVLFAEGKRTEWHHLESDWGESFRLATRHLLEQLRAGRPDVALSPEEGRRVLEFGLAVRRSGETGERVSLAGEGRGSLSAPA